LDREIQGLGRVQAVIEFRVILMSIIIIPTCAQISSLMDINHFPYNDIFLLYF